MNGLAHLSGEEPRLLLQLGGEVLDDAGGGGVLLVDGAVHVTQGDDDSLDGGDDVGDGVGGEDLALRSGRHGGRGDHGGGTAVGGRVDGTHPLGHVVGARAGNVDDRVEVQVQVAEVWADDVPVSLLADQLKGDEVHQDALEVVAQRGGRGEREVDIRGVDSLGAHGLNVMSVPEETRAGLRQASLTPGQARNAATTTHMITPATVTAWMRHSLSAPRGRRAASSLLPSAGHELIGSNVVNLKRSE